MPNVIKSATTVSAGTIKKNNFVIGVNTSVSYGPTSTTNFWNGIVPPYSGYTVYEQKSSQGPSIKTAADDSELITIAKQYGGTNINTVSDALTYFNGQSGYLVTNIDYPSIVTDGLVLNLDAGYVPSYPRTGTVWTDLSGNNNDGTLINNPTYSSDNGGSIIFDVSGEYVNCPLSSTIQSINTNNSLTISTFIKVATFNQFRDFVGVSKISGNNPFALRADTTNKHFFDFEIGGVRNRIYYPETTSSILNIWVQLTATIGDNSVKIYSNGIKVGNTLIVSGNIKTIDSPFRVGFLGYNYFLGSISNTQLYNRALSEAEVLQNFDSLKSRYGL